MDVSKVKILNNNPYRFSDIFKDEIPDKDFILNEPRYADSILVEYLKKKKFKADIETLRQVVGSHCKKYPQPKPDELVIHCRLGDWGHNDQDLIDKIGEHVNPDSFSQITAVTALHYGNRESSYSSSNYKTDKATTFKDSIPEHKSFDFLLNLSNKVKSIGYDLQIYSNENIDQDICYMAQSHFFTPHSRRFSVLMLCLLHDNAKVLPIGNESNYTLQMVNTYNKSLFGKNPVKYPTIY